MVERGGGSCTERASIQAGGEEAMPAGMLQLRRPGEEAIGDAILRVGNVSTAALYSRTVMGLLAAGRVR